jgi:hypothetical protein
MRGFFQGLGFIGLVLSFFHIVTHKQYGWLAYSSLSLMLVSLGYIMFDDWKKGKRKTVMVLGFLLLVAAIWIYFQFR